MFFIFSTYFIGCLCTTDTYFGAKVRINFETEIGKRTILAETSFLAAKTIGFEVRNQKTEEKAAKEGAKAAFIIINI